MENHDHTALIQKLLDCTLACKNCAAECLHEEDVSDMARCISLDWDCADMCIQATRLLKRNSEIGHQYLVLCEEICRMCGDECGKYENDHCQQCAEACIICAEACHGASRTDYAGLGPPTP